MLQQIYLALGELFIRLFFAVSVSIFLYRFSVFFFDIDIKSAIQSDNRSATQFFMAIIVMVGLVVGLFQL